MIPLLARAAQAVVKLARNPAARRKIVEVAQKVPSAFQNASRAVVQGCRAWGRNRAIRQVYNANKRLLKRDLAQMRKAGASKQSMAERAHKFRKDERLFARDQMRKNGDGKWVKKLESRDLKKYGNKDGPTFQHTSEKAKADLTKVLKREPTQSEVYDAVAESATRTDVLTNLKFLAF